MSSRPSETLNPIENRRRSGLKRNSKLGFLDQVVGQDAEALGALHQLLGVSQRALDERVADRQRSDRRKATLSRSSHQATSCDRLGTDPGAAADPPATASVHPARRSNSCWRSPTAMAARSSHCPALVNASEVGPCASTSNGSSISWNNTLTADKRSARCGSSRRHPASVDGVSRSSARRLLSSFRKVHLVAAPVAFAMSSSQRATTSSRPRRNDAPMIGAVSAIVIEPRSQREEISRQVSAIDRRDVRRRQRSEGSGCRTSCRNAPDSAACAATYRRSARGDPEPS